MFLSPSANVGDLRYGANETLRAFQKVLHLYKSGLYLQKKTSHLKEYITLKEFHSTDAEDYKCWPSYSHLRCMLSVHNAEEAATICNSHPQCQHFTITPQRTWTGKSNLTDPVYSLFLSHPSKIFSFPGRPLALFQSNLSDLIPGGHMVVYVKQSAASRKSFSWGA
ncbi:hypothetical protein JD844_020731 [Phrynosoma platyrhinos]|uniref:Uncharacterized protein n=1 Tax=Phrynosoma platyrhinos TaxID=52577 RepID=A0ABQ7SSY1_PHRPL|nr:hypothetical protein JD844_020731 [Phrynosoma platyrhinos]